MQYNELLKELRIASGKTQKQLGEECGYPGTYAERMVRSWEAGKLYPKITKLRTLANALNVPVDKVVPW